MRTKLCTWQSVLFLGLLFLMSCDSSSQTDARDDATEASCNYYEMCDEIGEGKTFETRDTCEVQARAFWEAAWPKEDCEDNISSDALDLCLDEINSAQCGNILDFLSTLDKCSSADICT